jgi:hypothetical protein
METGPPAEDEVIQGREWDEIPNRWYAVFGAFTEADCPKLRQRPDGWGEAPTREKTAREKRARDGAHTG